jgi:hypothetical protein
MPDSGGAEGKTGYDGSREAVPAKDDERSPTIERQGGIDEGADDPETLPPILFQPAWPA